MRLRRQRMLKLGAHAVNLSLDGVAGNRAFGPTFGHHGAHPQPRKRKNRWISGYFCSGVWHLNGATVQSKVRGTRPDFSCQHGLKLGSCLQPLHGQARALPSEIRQPGACGLWRGVR